MTTAPVPHRGRKWTVLLYQRQGGRGRYREHLGDTNEFESLVPDERVTLMSQSVLEYGSDRMARCELRPANCREPHEFLQALDGKQAESARLAEFINWGMKSYPAEHTCLVLSGFDGDGNSMPLPLVASSIEAGRRGELDILAFDGSWMASADAVAEFRDAAEYMVASQCRNEGWNYARSFGGLVRRPESKPEDLIRELVSADQGNSAMTAFDLTAAAAFVFKPVYNPSACGSALTGFDPTR